MPKAYNKLVRDRIPEIIAREGHTPVVAEMSKEAYLIARVDKLREAVTEYAASPAAAELVDILEIVYAIGEDRYGLPHEALEQLRQEKRFHRGGFKKRLLLVEVEE